MTKLLSFNAELKLAAADKEKELHKEIDNLRDQLAEENKQIEEWHPQV